MFLFTDFVSDSGMRYTLGWVFSGIITVNLVSNWIILFSRLLKQPIAWIRKKIALYKQAKKAPPEVKTNEKDQDGTPAIL